MEGDNSVKNLTSSHISLTSLMAHGLKTYLAFAALGLFILLYLRSKVPLAAAGNKAVDVPVVGSGNPIVARWEFFRNASKLVDQGYSKVRTAPDNFCFRKWMGLTANGSIKTKSSNFLAMTSWYFRGDTSMSLGTFQTRRSARSKQISMYAAHRGE